MQTCQYELGIYKSNIKSKLEIANSSQLTNKLALMAEPQRSDSQKTFQEGLFSMEPRAAANKKCHQLHSGLLANDPFPRCHVSDVCREIIRVTKR